MFDKILGWFEDAGVPVKIRVFAEKPRQFFDVNTQQARSLLRGDIEAGQDGVELEDSTEKFVRLF
jgi:hypothetical protein